MRRHRFAVGSRVTYTQARFPNLLSGEACKIVALLPSGSREPRYQVRCPTLTGRLVVSESELGDAPEPGGPGAAEDEVSELAPQSIGLAARL